MRESNSSSSEGEESKVVDYVIVSEHYWPSIPREPFTYHPSISTLLEAYQSTYAVLKKPRKLHPALQLGHVEVELDFDDGTVRTFCVTPMQVHTALFFLLLSLIIFHIYFELCVCFPIALRCDPWDLITPSDQKFSPTGKRDHVLPGAWRAQSDPSCFTRLYQHLYFHDAVPAQVGGPERGG